MTLKHTPCGYHPDRVAVTVCERCRRPICLEDKRIFRQAHSTSGDDSYTFYTSHDLCILCNSAQLSAQARYSPFLLLCIIPFPIFFIIIFIWMWTSSPSSPGGIFDILFPVFFIGVPLFMIIGVIFGVESAKKRAHQAELEAIEFKNSLSNQYSHLTFQKYQGSSFDPPRHSNDFSSTTLDKFSPLSLICFECGNPITKKERFCSNCGDSTKEELEKHYGSS